MEKNVLIRVSSLQIPDNGAPGDTFEVMVPGEYFFRGGKHYLRYEEEMEGFSEPVKNLIRMDTEGMDVKKTGLIFSDMHFFPGESMSGPYKTPLGIIRMEFHTTAYLFEIEEDHLLAQASYGLSMDNAHVADCTVRIEARERQEP